MQFNIKRSQRIATMLMYLSDDVEGGETYFPRVIPSFIKKKIQWIDVYLSKVFHVSISYIHILDMSIEHEYCSKK